jgi:hypothetical protein
VAPTLAPVLPRSLLPTRTPPPAHWRTLSQAERDALLQANRGAPLAERVLALSARFLGTPYVHSPLGEGEGPDPDPLFRDDAVDCLTFVEQSLALALAERPGDVGPLLARLRYDGEVRYADRNHLMEAQWLPANVRRGFLRDVTRQVGGAATVRTEKVLTRASWASGSSRALALPPERQLRGRFPLEVLPLEALQGRLDVLPVGSILLVVREERAFKATRVTHLGFVVRKEGRTFLRHASRDPFQRVVDEDLARFLGRNSRYARWPVVGVSVFAPERPAAPGAGAPAASAPAP